MRITLDATPIGVRTNDKGGVYRYISRLIAGIAEVAPPHQFRLLFNFCRAEHRDAFVEARSAAESLGFEVVRGRIPAALWLRGLVPAELAAGRVDVFHGLYDFVPPVLVGAAVLTVHDLRYVTLDGSEGPEITRLIQDSPELLTDYRQRLDFFKRQRGIIRRVARRARLIVTPSEFSKGAIVDSLGVPAERVRVVPHGVSEDLRIPVVAPEVDAVLQRHGIAGPYLLSVGKMDPLKNVDTLLRAFATIRRDAQVRLVLAGPAGWYGAVLRRRAEDLGITDDVRFLGHVTDRDLKVLYQGARVMVFPSLFEGFGLPVLEAMASGTPVVCSNHCSLPEVAGDAALLVDPAAPGALAEAVLSVLRDEALQERLRRAGLGRSAAFTWRESAMRTVSVYEDAAGG
jgi:glycosyltransferase involved in cell wall biosynthesis